MAAGTEIALVVFIGTVALIAIAGILISIRRRD
jgi:hypothetical protein